MLHITSDSPIPGIPKVLRIIIIIIIINNNGTNVNNNNNNNNNDNNNLVHANQVINDIKELPAAFNSFFTSVFCPNNNNNNNNNNNKQRPNFYKRSCI